MDGLDAISKSACSFAEMHRCATELRLTDGRLPVLLPEIEGFLRRSPLKVVVLSIMVGLFCSLA
jgi:hypothetical protein